MSNRPTRALRAALGAALLAVPLLLGAQAQAAPGVPGAPGAPGASGEPNSDPSYLQVYDANVENLATSGETCPGDWHDLLYYMRTRPHLPDVFLVQQLSGKGQLDLLLQRMEEHFGEEFAGVVAEESPKSLGDDGPCGADKEYQTNAVVWRTARLDLKLSDSPDNRWQAQAHMPPPGDPDGTRACRNNTQSRTKGVKALLHDRASGKDVTAASFHWRTWTYGHQCAESNAGELSNELTEDGYGGADLFLAGGDTNYSSSSTNGGTDWTAWYRDTNGDLAGSRHGFRDAVYAGCAASGGDLGACLGPKWTLHSPGKEQRRIDFLLARKPGGAMPRTSDAVVPTFDEGDQAALDLTGSDDPALDYSDHRAIGARVHY